MRLDRPRAARLVDLEHAMARTPLGVEVLAEDAEQPVVEPTARRTRDLLDALAQPDRRELTGAVVAERVVAGSPEQWLGGGGAATHARLRVVAAAAEPPQIVAGAR